MMTAPARVAERLSSLEARMTALEQLPNRIDRLESGLRSEIRAGDEALREEMRAGHVLIVTALTEQIEESRRYTRVLHDDALDRIRVIGEGLAAHDVKIDALSDRVDALSDKVDALSDKVDALFGKVGAVQAENRLMFAQVLARIDAM